MSRPDIEKLLAYCAALIAASNAYVAKNMANKGTA